MEILQVAQHADDLDRAAAFYEMLLGGPPAGRFEPGLLFFNVGRSRLLLEQAAASALVYLEVDDVHATLDRLRASGVEVVSEPQRDFQPRRRHASGRPGMTSGWPSSGTARGTPSAWSVTSRGTIPDRIRAPDAVDDAPLTRGRLKR